LTYFALRHGGSPSADMALKIRALAIPESKLGRKQRGCEWWPRPQPRVPTAQQSSNGGLFKGKGSGANHLLPEGVNDVVTAVYCGYPA
jgi:hypothetical protein